MGAAGQGLAASALVAAALGVAGSVLNAASTLWSIDIAQDMLLWTVSEADLIRRGRWSSLVALLAGAAATPLVWWWNQGILAYVQEATALVAPPLAVVFLAAFFWPRAHGRAATFTLISGVVTGALCWAAALSLLEPPPGSSRRWSVPASTWPVCALRLGGEHVPHSRRTPPKLRPRHGLESRSAARLPNHEADSAPGRATWSLVGGHAGGDNRRMVGVLKRAKPAGETASVVVH